MGTVFKLDKLNISNFAGSVSYISCIYWKDLPTNLRNTDEYNHFILSVKRQHPSLHFGDITIAAF